MLNPTLTVDTQTLLENTNAISSFTPQASTNNAMKVNQHGKILVVTRNEGLNLTEHLQRLEIREEDSFVHEKQILLWHLKQLIPFLEERLEALKSMPKRNLLEYHDYFMRFQGIYALCNNLVLQLTTFNNLIAQAENPHKEHWSMLFKLQQRSLSENLNQLLSTAQSYVATIANERNERLSRSSAEPDVQLHGPFLLFGLILRTLPQDFTLGKITLEERGYRVKAHFETYRTTWENPTNFPFTGKLVVKVYHNQNEQLHAALRVYPSWTYGELPKPTPIKKIDFPEDSAHKKLKKLYDDNKEGVIALQPVTLRASFTDICEHVKSYQLLPYFVTLVDIAKAQGITDITVFAPYNYSAIMYAFGFYINYRDLARPTKLEQHEVVETAFSQGKKVPLMAQHFNRQTENLNPEPIFRPFSFSLQSLDVTPVYLTKSRVKTTYAALLSKPVLSEKDYPQGVFPEVHQIPLRFSGVYSALRKRELTGHMDIPKVSFAMEKVDYQALDSDKSLMSYAYSDPDASRESGHQKMLTLRRKYKV